MITASDSLEISIIGSSRAEYDYYPDIISTRCHNYGIPGTRYDLVEILLNYEFKKNKKSPVILNFDYDFFDKGFGDLNNYIPNVGHQDIRTYMGDKFKFYYLIPTIRYYGAFELYTKFYLNEKFNLTKETNKGGSLEKNKMTEQRFREDGEFFKANPIEWKIDSLKSKKFISLLKSTKRTVIIVLAPYHPILYNTFKNVNEFNEYMKILNDLPNIHVINFCPNKFSDDMYYDLIHLNYKGAKQFSADLRDSILTAGIVFN